MKNNNKKRVRLNESTLRQMIRESLKNIIREENELEDDPSTWGGIDDYPENETPEEQWRKLNSAQYGDAYDDQHQKDWQEFTETPYHMFPELGQDADFQLRNSALNGFQRNEQGRYGMNALDPNLKSGREPRMYNGYEYLGNPSSAKYLPVGKDEGLPQEYLKSLNESISRAIKKVIGDK